MMIEIVNKVFDEAEEEYFKKNPEGDKQKIKVDLYNLIVQFTSEVVISGFLGMDSLK